MGIDVRDGSAGESMFGERQMSVEKITKHTKPTKLRLTPRSFTYELATMLARIQEYLYFKGSTVLMGTP